jgi:tRNA pseudouridine38-40 synthase
MLLKLTIAYDGRNHAGWQSQAGGNTVQDIIEQAIAVTAKQPIRIHGSGRTDSGVHALAQTAHFEAPGHITMDPSKWVPALNVKLPASIRILSCEEAPAGFHARFSATAKTYRFELRTEPVLSPFFAGFAWHVPRPLDPGALRAALACYPGYHNFQAFAALRGNEKPDTDFHRTVRQAAIESHDHGYSLIFTADGFLYKMIRFLAGSAVRCAHGKLTPEEIAGLLDQAAHLPLGKAPYCAPPAGLFLQQVHYD